VDFFILNTHNFFGGEDIEFSIRWIKEINWNTKKVYIKLSKEYVKAAGE